MAVVKVVVATPGPGASVSCMRGCCQPDRCMAVKTASLLCCRQLLNVDSSSMVMVLDGVGKTRTLLWVLREECEQLHLFRDAGCGL
jgi:hypothetical protein